MLLKDGAEIVATIARTAIVTMSSINVNPDLKRTSFPRTFRRGYNTIQVI